MGYDVPSHFANSPWPKRHRYRRVVVDRRQRRGPLNGAARSYSRTHMAGRDALENVRHRVRVETRTGSVLPTKFRFDRIPHCTPRDLDVATHRPTDQPTLLNTRIEQPTLSRSGERNEWRGSVRATGRGEREGERKEGFLVRSALVRKQRGLLRAQLYSLLMLIRISFWGIEKIQKCRKKLK